MQSDKCQNCVFVAFHVNHTLTTSNFPIFEMRVVIFVKQQKHWHEYCRVLYKRRRQTTYSIVDGGVYPSSRMPHISYSMAGMVKLCYGTTVHFYFVPFHESRFPFHKAPFLIISHQPLYMCVQFVILYGCTAI